MSKPVILCVDDEKIVLNSLKEQLKRAFRNDYSVETAEGGKDALDLFEELLEDHHEIPLIISDYIMPDIKGDDVLKHIHGISPETRKIMLTGQANLEGISNAVNHANLYRYISKPWEQEDLVLTVSEAVKSYYQARQLEFQNKKLKESEQKYRSIFENAMEGIYRSSPEGFFLTANPAFARIFGYESPEELIQTVTDIQHQIYVNPEQRAELLLRLEQEDMITDFQVQQYRKDGKKIWVSLNMRAVRDKHGKIEFIEGNVQDITVRREKEKAEIAREIAEAANKKITDSINYAKIIQRSLLTSKDVVKAHLPHSFTIWMPRDIVGGDIVFSDFFKDGMVIAVADCTGHGVPGAFMTMIASSGLSRIIRDDGCHDPAHILKQLNFIVKNLLKQDTEQAESDDGLDAGICFVKPAENTLVFAGARIALYYTREGEICTIKGDKENLGYKRSDLDFNFTNHKIDIEKGMCFYMATDGFADQIGGKEKRRFGTGRLTKLLKEINNAPFEKQKSILIQAFEEHRGEHERQDDVTVAGFGF